MNMKTHTMRTIVLAGLVAVATAGCNEETHSHQHGSGAGGAGGAGKGAQATAPLPDGLLLTEPPADVRELAAGLSEADDGDPVAVRGKIGGRVDPFVAGRAVMVLVDLSIPDCDAKGDDHCPTPWDYCCEPADHLARHAATVQVNDADGKVLRANLNGAGGIAPGADVIVRGTLSKKESARTIHATGIYVIPKEQS